MNSKGVVEIERLRKENEQLKLELEKTKSELSERLKEISKHHQEIKDSVRYAKRIQTAIQPPYKYIQKLLTKSFVLYLPKDVVSGDFYFVEKYNETVVFSAVDCTGHGIPGAMMSVVGFNYLDAAVKQGITQPAEILHYLDKGVNDKLRQTGGESGVNDGMDLSVCSLTAIDANRVQLEYAGAYNSLYVLTNKSVLRDLETYKNDSGEIIHQPKCSANGVHLFEVKADKFPIGVNTDGIADFYTNHSITLHPGDQVILFSDGFADQFGGDIPGGKKYKYKTLRNFLLKIADLDSETQKEQLKQEFYSWKGENEQVDDILIFGVRI